MKTSTDVKSAFKLQTDALYRDITQILYEPEHEVEFIQTHKAGEKRSWKFLGILPVFNYTVKYNRFRMKDIDYAFRSMDAFLEYLGTDWYLMRDGKMYRKSFVKVFHVNDKNNETNYFDSNASALNYIEELKRKCKECGNLLS